MSSTLPHRLIPNREVHVINKQAPLVISRSLTLEINPSGQLVGTNSVSRLPQVIELDALPVLMGFASAAKPGDVLRRLKEEWELDDDGFEIVVEALLSQNFLTPVTDQAQAPPALAQHGFSSLLSHHAMLRDTARVMSYRSAISRHCPGKVVVEVGCGTGILSIFAAQAGARRVIAIEESQIAGLALEMFEANGVSDVIDLRLGNSRDVELDEPADVIVHEILGVDPFAENILRYIDDARGRLLKAGGRLLPRRIEVFVAGLELAEPPRRDRRHMMAEAEELAGLYGLDFTPYLRQVSELDERYFSARVPISDGKLFEPTILSEECRLFDIDLQADDLQADDLQADGSSVADQLSGVRLKVQRKGTLAGMVLYFRAHLDETTWLSTSPFAPRTSWGWDVRRLSRRLAVEAGDQVELAVEIDTWMGRQRLNVNLPHQS